MSDLSKRRLKLWIRLLAVTRTAENRLEIVASLRASAPNSAWMAWLATRHEVK